MNPICARLFAIAYKETLQVWRDPRSLAIALLMPLMQMALLGYGVSLDIRRVPLCIYDQENSQISRELVERSPPRAGSRSPQTLGTSAAVRAAMDRGDCVGAVTIPVDFSRVLATTGNAVGADGVRRDRHQHDQYRHRLRAGRDRPDDRRFRSALGGGARAAAADAWASSISSRASGSTKGWTAAISSSPAWSR